MGKIWALYGHHLKLNGHNMGPTWAQPDTKWAEYGPYQEGHT